MPTSNAPLPFDGEKSFPEALGLDEMGIWAWDPESQTMHWSAHLYELLGVETDEFDPSFEGLLRFIHADDRESVRALVQQSSREAEKEDFECQYQPHDSADVRWLQATVRPVESKDDTPRRVVGAIQDITRLREAEVERDQARQQLELVFEAAPLAFFVSTPEGTVQQINPAFGENFGLSAEESAGENVRELGLWIDFEDRREVLGQLRAGNRVRGYPTRFRTSSGETKEVELSVEKLQRENSSLLVWTIQDVTERNRRQRQLEAQSLFDSVTGLPNRNLLLDRIGTAIDRSERSGQPVAALYIDLNDFKAVNEEYGYDVGNRLLEVVAKRLQAAVRTSDTVARPAWEPGPVARIAGDEFALLLDEAGQRGAVRVAQRLLECFEAPFEVVDQPLHVTASIGVAVRNPREEGLQREEDLLQASQTAMRQVKTGDPAGYHVFGPEDRKRVGRLHRRERLRRAFEEDELLLYYQPIIDLTDRSVPRAEALVRWEHPKYGLVPPAEFVPFAEETGLLWKLDRWVLREAIRQVFRWREENTGVEAVNVNVEAHRRGEKDFQRDVLRLLNEKDLPGEALTLEVTERLRGSQPFGRLRRAGVRLAIGDFGTGYSSLFYLRHLEADALKLDQFFTQELGTHEETGTIVRAVLDIAEHFGVETIAEGVETEVQFNRLRELGCSLAQGYFFARPMSASRFEHFVERAADSTQHHDDGS